MSPHSSVVNQIRHLSGKLRTKVKIVLIVSSHKGLSSTGRLTTLRSYLLILQRNRQTNLIGKEDSHKWGTILVTSVFLSEAPWVSLLR